MLSSSHITGANITGRNVRKEGCLLLQWLVCVCVHTQWCPSRCNPMDCNPIAPLSIQFSRQEYWNGLPSPSPGDVPPLGIESVSPASPALTGGFFTAKPPGKLKNIDGSWANGESLVMAFYLLEGIPSTPPLQ